MITQHVETMLVIVIENLTMWYCCPGKAKTWPAKFWNIKVLIRSIESVIMILFTPIISRNLTFFATLCKTKSCFCCLTTFDWYIHLHHKIPIWQTQCYLVSTNFYISLPFALIGKKCETCIAQQVFQHTLTWLTWRK